MKTIPEVGDMVTISRKDRRDRSYQNELWVVIAQNKTHTQLKAAKPRRILSNTIIVLTEEYDFADAKSFLVDGD